MPQILSDEIASAIWTGDTITPDLLNQVTEIPKPNDGEGNEDGEGKVTPANEEVIDPAGNKITRIFSEDGEDDDDEEEEDEGGGNNQGQTATPPAAKASAEPKKPGRKPTDLVTAVTKLIEDGELLGFADDAEIKTNEDAIELLKANLKTREEEALERAFAEKVKAYSPQVQAILHYAEQGAQSAGEDNGNAGAIKDIEDLYEVDISNERGQEAVVRQYYKSKGFKEAYIEKQLSLIKDAGKENLKEEAEAFLPDLVAENEKRIQQRIVEKEETKRRAEEASRMYISTVKTTLTKADRMDEVPLAKEDKYKVFEAIANPKYTSLNGSQTTQFVKTLEELQFGEKPNYEHFLNIVRYTIDPKGFIESLKGSIEGQVSATTQRKLRETRTVSPASTQAPARGQTAKKTIPKEFTNPFA